MIWGKDDEERVDSGFRGSGVQGLVRVLREMGISRWMSRGLPTRTLVEEKDENGDGDSINYTKMW